MIKKGAKEPVIVIARYPIRQHTSNETIDTALSKVNSVLNTLKTIHPTTKIKIENTPNPTILKTPLFS